jgi:hypothetical protein
MLRHAVSEEKRNEGKGEMARRRREINISL